MPELELVRRARGCVESPVAALIRELNSLDEGEELILKVDPSYYPVKAIKMLVEKRGFKFQVLEEGEVVKCSVTR